MVLPQTATNACPRPSNAYSPHLRLLYLDAVSRHVLRESRVLVDEGVDGGEVFAVVLRLEGVLHLVQPGVQVVQGAAK